MYVAITKELSIELRGKFDFISQHGGDLKAYFEDRFYGEDLRSIYIAMVCMSPKFEIFHKPRRPKYKTEGRVYIAHGIQVISEGMSLEYDLKLDFDTYFNASKPEPIFAEEVFKSLEVIKMIKKIKDFDYEAFRRDFEAFFWQVGWLS